MRFDTLSLIHINVRPVARRYTLSK